jgi:hypothetical protein
VVYEDFKLLATDVQVVKEENKKRVLFRLQVSESPVGEQIEGISSEYDSREMRNHLRGWEERELDWPDVIQLGAWLGTVLFPPHVHSLLVRSLERVRARERGLRIRLLLTGELHNVPWEYVLLNKGGGEATVTDFLALMPDVSIVRHQVATMPAEDIQAELPAQMVVALASPAGHAPVLDLEEEHQAIKQALEENPYVEAVFVTEATPANLLSDVTRAHLFHFAGHGTFEGKMGDQPGVVEGKGAIVLDDGYGDPEPLDAGELALRLRKIGVRAAVLGACRSGRRDDVNVWSSVATALLKADLGAVVGMQYKVRDDSAIAFARAFYKALIAGLPIDEAVTNGRLEISQSDVRGWGVPVLYLRAPNGVIFPEQAADPALEPVRGQLRVDAEQRITELRGKAVVVDIGEMTEGDVKARQVIGTVAEDAEATTVRIERLGGGTVEAKQEADRVDGSVTGVKIDEL